MTLLKFTKLYLVFTQVGTGFDEVSNDNNRVGIRFRGGLLGS